MGILIILGRMKATRLTDMKNLLVILALLWSSSSFALTADSYIITELDGTVLAENNADAMKPIASITKLMIAQRSAELDPNELIEIIPSDIKSGRMRSTPLRAGKSYTRAQLTELALVSSDNVAAIALGRSVEFKHTAHATLVEASGLSPENQASARGLASLATSMYMTEAAAVSTRTTTEVGNRKNTNPLITKTGWTFYLSKTGFINKSGGCLVVITEMGGRVVVAVILGAANTKERWRDLAELRRSLGDSDFYVPVKVTSVTKVKKARRSSSVQPPASVL